MLINVIDDKKESAIGHGEQVAKLMNNGYVCSNENKIRN